MSKYKQETIFMKTENSKTNELHEFVLNLSQRLDLRSSNKYNALKNFSIYLFITCGNKYKTTV